jgi:putative aldouronate transport system substrate-binding protein
MFSPTEVMRFAEQGVILPVQDLIETDSIYFKQRLGEYEGWRELITLPNGSIYTLPSLNECYHCMYYGKMWINKLFLRNVGIDKYPTTIEEFHDMLVAFRDKDANGNGDPNDEVPFMGAVGGYSSKVDTYIMSAFVFDDGENRLYLDRGKVTAAFTKSEFQEGLRVLHQWYREGLIAPESFTQSWDTRYKANSVKYESIVGAHPFEHMFNLGNREDGQPVRWIDYEAIPPLVGPRGLQITRHGYYTKFQYDWPAGFIPATAKNPALVIRWLDWFMSDEGTLTLMKGGKGISWTDADPGATGPDGRPARFKNIIMNPGDPYYGNTSFGQNFPNFSSSEFRNMDQTADDMLAPDGSGAERYLYVISRDNYAPYAADISMLIPPLFYSPENASEMAMLTTNINTYVDECIAKFVVGDMNVETDWNRFQNELRNLGIDRYLSLIQAAYDSSAFAK